MSNQYVSTKTSLLRHLAAARRLLDEAKAARTRSPIIAALCIESAQAILRRYRGHYAAAPASTRRRWRAGR